MARDILFREFPHNTLTILSSGGSLTDEGLARLLDEASREFLKEMEKGRKGAEFVRAVYKVVDRLTAEWAKGNKIACQAGCSWCCLQMVSCTYAEAELIKQHLESLPKKQRQVIIKRVNQEAIYLHKLFREIERQGKAKSPFGRLFGLNAVDVGLSAYAEHRRQLRPCPYLGPDKKCGIYHARPIDCRIAKTKVRCGREKEGDAEKPKEIKLLFDQAATNLIMDEQRRMTGRSEVIPLAGWPLIERFKGFFKPDSKLLS